MFLTKLAWESRVTLPMLITAAFMALNFRWEIEINIHTDRYVFQEEVDESGSDLESWESVSTDDDSDDDMPEGYPIDYEY